MKLIDSTKKPAPDSPLQQTLARLQAALPFGQSEGKAQEAILARFQRALDNRYVMVRDAGITPPGEPAPLILLGPMGVMAININSEQGIYRVKDDSWWELNKSTRKFQPARRNLIKQTQAAARTVSAYLDNLGKTHPEVTPVLIFAHPGVHVDSARPAVRIVLVDGVERLLANVLQAEEALTTAEVKLLADPFERLLQPAITKPGAEEDFFGKDLAQPEKPKTPTLPDIQLPEVDLPLPPFLKRLKFSKGQWILLGVMAFFTVLILIGFIIMMFITA